MFLRTMDLIDPHADRLELPLGLTQSSAPWSLSPRCGSCRFAPNICSSLPELCTGHLNAVLTASWRPRSFGGICFLVALRRVRDLLLCAKYLFVAATQGIPRDSCRAAQNTWTGRRLLKADGGRTSSFS